MINAWQFAAGLCKEIFGCGYAHIMYGRAGHPRVTLVKFKENLVRELIGGNALDGTTSLEVM